MNYGKKGTLKKKKSVNSKTKQMGKKAGLIFFKAFLICIIAIGVVGVCAGVGVIKGVMDNAPDITTSSVIPRGYKSVVLDSAGNKTADLIAEGSNRVYVEIEKIPKYVQEAFIAVEDERFYEHNGIDVKGIIRAGIRGISRGFKFNEGASTITQQLLKNSVFDFMSEDGFAEKVERKLQEQYLAIKLEEIMTKEEILEAYLNTINLGQNTLGIQAAANRYFGKDVSDLTISEAAVIAGITKNPAYNNPISYPEDNRKRQEIVLLDMKDQGYITQEEYEEALADDVYSRIKTRNEETPQGSVYSYYVDATIDSVIEDLQEYKGYTYQQAYNALYYGGLTIESAQDPAIQAIMDEEMQNEENYPSDIRYCLEYALTVESPDGEQKNYSKENMIEYFRETTGKEDFTLIFDDVETGEQYIEDYKNSIVKEGDKVYESIDFTPQPQASMVIMDQATGIVKGIVGGRGVKEKSRTLNRATGTVRQPGSTFKIVSTYAPALDTAGMTLGTTQFDAPYAYKSGKTVRNWNREAYRGWTTLRKGIEQSMNIVAVKTITDITPDMAYSYLISFGFTSLVGETDANGNSDIGQATALGGLTHGVSNLELTAAYACIANGGVYTEPVFYTRILDHDGKVLIDKEPQTRTVIKASTAWLLTSAMKDVVTQGTGTPARFNGMSIAGKTGTTSANNDIWFVGYTPYYTAGIWAGIDNNEKLKKGEVNFHKTLWKKVMSRIHEELPNKDFEMPDSITSAVICNQSGKLPIPGICDGCVQTEYFAKGTVPTEYCDVHQVGTACIESNQLATDACPGVEARIITLIPADLQAPCSSALPRNLVAPVCSLHPGNVIGALDPGLMPPVAPEGTEAQINTGEAPPAE